MPKLGEIKRGNEVGFTTYHKAMWCACPDCGKERWVLLRGGKPQSERCHPCGAKIGGAKKKENVGPKHWHWSGGRKEMTNGYVGIWVSADSPFAPMRNKDGYIYEHRLVMAQHLGRCLETWEEVHHLNHDKHDNRTENLELLSKSEHAFGHYGKNKLIDTIRRLQARINELEGKR